VVPVIINTSPFTIDQYIIVKLGKLRVTKKPDLKRTACKLLIDFFIPSIRSSTEGGYLLPGSK
jgi:hypothetical protein